MEEEINTQMYTRGLGIFNPEKQRFNLKIFGVGSIGSFLTLNLAKLGFSDITVFDFDKIELHNISNQFYRISDIGKLKTEALKEVTKEFSDINLNIINEKITPQNTSMLAEEININSILVLCFDTLKSRKLVYDALKGYPNILLDLRMGGLEYSIQVVQLNDDKQCKAYEESLKKKTKNLPCGMQSTLFVLLNIASEASKIVVAINNNENYPKILKRNMNSYLFINDLK